MKPKIYTISIFILSLTLCSCSGEKEKTTPEANQGGYFSIIDFTKDQWSTFHGQPFGIAQYTTLNGHTDSTFLSALKMKWSPIFEIFFKTDISDPKFNEQYDFETFEENLTQTRTFTYTAKKASLYTRKLQIAADMYTNKIRNIYIETEDKNFWNTQSQKLFYSPVRFIQIQEHNEPLIGKSKDLIVEYKFL